MSAISHGFETGHGERGFTLLELLVVVLLMSAMAWMALGVVTDNTSQIRYDDTRNRLAAIRQAIAGSIQPSAPENGMPSSFVTDNGLLPDKIDTLVNMPTIPAGSWGSFGQAIPWFDPTPGTNGFPGTPPGTPPDEIQLNNLLYPEVTLAKGHRGFYLNGVSVSGSYRDGWGTNRTVGGADGIRCPTLPTGAVGNEGSDDDDKNHGWCVTSYDEGLYVDSYGMDGVRNTPPIDGYEADMTMSPPVLRDDWTVDISGSTVKIINLSSTAVAEEIGASLLVYVNGRGPDLKEAWRRITSDTITGIPVYDPTNSSTVVTVNFPTTDRIPVGEHLLILFRRTAGTPSTDNPNLVVLPAIRYVTARVKFFPRGGIPELKLVIR